MFSRPAGGKAEVDVRGWVNAGHHLATEQSDLAPNNGSCFCAWITAMPKTRIGTLPPRYSLLLNPCW